MNVSQHELRNKTLLAGNEVEKEIGLGSDIIAMQLINIVSNILNNKNDAGDYALKENQRVS